MFLYHGFRSKKREETVMSMKNSLSGLWGLWVDNIALNEGAMRLPHDRDIFRRERRLNLFDLKAYDFNDTFEVFNLSEYRGRPVHAGKLTG